MEYEHSEEGPAGSDRSTLVRELDGVLVEVAERLQADIAAAKEIAERVRSDWRIYHASRQLRDRFAKDEWTGAEIDPDAASGLVRWLRDLDREREFQRRTRFAQAEGPAASRMRPPAIRAERSIGNAGDRIAQVRLILERAEQPMETSEITEVLERAGELRGVVDARATVSAALSRATRMGVIERVSRGTYQLPGAPEHTGPEGPPPTTQGKEDAPHEQEVPPPADI